MWLSIDFANFLPKFENSTSGWSKLSKYLGKTFPSNICEKCGICLQNKIYDFECIAVPPPPDGIFLESVNISTFSLHWSGGVVFVGKMRRKEFLVGTRNEPTCG